MDYTSKHVGDNGATSKVHAMPTDSIDGKIAICGRKVQWINANAHDYDHEITCLSCIKVMRKAEATANTDRFIAELDMIESVLAAHKNGSFAPSGMFLGDGVSFLTGTAKGAQSTLTRRTGEVVDIIRDAVGTGVMVFVTYAVREYGTNEVFEVNSGRVRLLDYGTWESAENGAILTHMGSNR